MESLGYIVTNKFIILAADSNLELTIGEGDDKISLNVQNARKIYKVSDNTAISIIGLPHKISDLYKYILNIKNSDKSYDAVIDDLKSIFASNPKEVIKKIQKVASIIPRFNDSNGVLKQDELFKHFEENPDLLQIAKESISMLQSGTELGTQICLFSRENGKNVFGKYISIAFNFVGQKQTDILKDNVYFSLVSAKSKIDNLKTIEQDCLKKLQPYIINGWENSKEDEQNLKNKAIELLRDSLIRLTPFKSVPNILFYELSEDTGFIFKEPDQHLTDIIINRK